MTIVYLESTLPYHMIRKFKHALENWQIATKWKIKEPKRN